MQKCVAVLAATSLLTALTISPSLAQYSRTSKGGNVVRTDGLEKVRPYMARPIIYIEDESPVVKDRRTVEEAPSYEIVVPPLKRPAGGGQGQAGGGGSNVIRLTPTGPSGQILANPGFESNMGSLQGPARPLPMGNSTGVHAQVDRPGNAGQSSPMRRPPSPGGPVVHTSITPGTAVYKDTPVVGGSTGGTRRTSTTVSAERIPPKRGDLLHGK